MGVDADTRTLVVTGQGTKEGEDADAETVQEEAELRKMTEVRNACV